MTSSELRSPLGSIATLRTTTLVLAALLVGLTGCPGLLPPNGGTDPNDADPNVAEKTLHERVFTELITTGFTDPADCMICHTDRALELLDGGHWGWRGEVANIEGLEGETHGKWDLLNNFCIAVPSNEGRCTQCHPSFGWKNNSFDLSDTRQVDCLVCHDTTGTYVKHPSANGGGGPPAFKVDGQFVLASNEELKEVAYNVGKPGRKNCGFCHFTAGGGDNVKHGDLGSPLVNATFEIDVHMNKDGLDFACQECHDTMNHGISGMPLHSVTDGGESPRCERCHGDSPHAGDVTASVLNSHTARISCEACHIPAFARQIPTKTEWYWSEAGQDVDPIPTDEFGKALYDKKKGRFVWAKNVRPTLLWFDGEWARKVINVSETYPEAGTADDPIIIAAPTATRETAGAKLYPFKRMIGDQPVDPVNQRIVVPHLFGKATGENPYWGAFDWALAIADGTTYAGQPFSGTYDFANTVMYLRVSHEIAPQADALTCNNCHGNDAFFQALGYDSDPLGGL